MKDYFRQIANAFQHNNQAGDIELNELPNPPVIWLLGKTGAGKSSLVRALTHASSAEIGNGFSSCTRNSEVFSFPEEQSLVKFLDTRGLGEIDYDPTEDLQICRSASHIVFVVARLDDPVQHDIANALRGLRKYTDKLPIAVIHTGSDLLTKSEAVRAQAANQQLFEKAAAKELPKIQVAMPPTAFEAADDNVTVVGIDEVIEHIASVLPEVAILFMQEQNQNHEAQMFTDQRATVIRYASAASSSDLAPIIGAVAVPTAQGLMLKALASAYGANWSKQRFGEFSAALGVATLARFGGSYLSRQLTKLIPGVGQTLGAVAASAVSFATTYALGRSAAYYLYHIKYNKPINKEQLRMLYKQALSESAQTLKRAKGSSNQ